MDMMPSLRTALLDILYETRDDELRLIVGGGYGIFLKREYVRRVGIRTLFQEWPEARSTNDLDLFLRPEVLVNPERLRPMSEALQRLGYRVVQGTEYYQFVKPGPTGGEEGSIKIDLLTGPQSRFRESSAKVDNRRVRPRPSVGLHAHTVDEALTLENDLQSIPIEGITSNDLPFQTEAYIPHPFTYIMMKLFAFRDRFADTIKDFGSYHALDIYSILAMTSETEWYRALKLHDIHRTDLKVQEANQIVAEYFSSVTSKGMIRMRESHYCRAELQLADFCVTLRELFDSRPLTDQR
ncbi:MAG: hypothetical protein ACKO5E_20865 [bacterium]